ncbi:MAG: aminotransferase class I/II-fold pyridoxal phosphate-dependent enzyme [Acidobacteria bacterium]|nr:aminotransferase class I/II-fold pyridoxal phosphate-dependent enzyme [Acidobacteriota bacterium]MBV9479259.1 aminotransferase class I/II-fold pyridoxal phosphate-dependent enzyme [Acidobacteriota bacterium]
MPATQTREITPAGRLENVRYAIRDLNSLADQVAKQGHRILPLNIGDPLNFDFETPLHLIEAVYKAMRDGKNGYAPSPGIPEAIRAIGKEAERKGIGNVQDIFVTSGVSEAVDVCLTALLNPGEQILTPRPDYPLYSAVLAKLGAQPNTYELNEDQLWQPDLEDLGRKITPQSRGIVLINPNNPTGAVCSRQLLESIAELARRHNLVIFADEIYDKLILDHHDRHFAIAALAPDVPVVTFGGLSKNYLAPGWRIGWAVVSGDKHAVKPYTEAINRLLRGRLCANHPEQYAIQAALEGPQDHLVSVLQKLRQRRDLTVNWSQTTPHVSCVAPRGAFYAFPRMEIPEGDDVFVRELIVEKHVMVVHGSGFGQKPGTKHLRIVFLPDEQILAQAYAAIAALLAERYG